MQEHDEEMERYLRKFQPRAVRQLGVLRQTEKPWLRRLAAAAVVVFAAGISLWYAQRKTTKLPETAIVQDVRLTPSVPQTRMNTLVLTKLAFEDGTAFDELLTDESRTALPRMEGEQSALRVLAKE